MLVGAGNFVDQAANSKVGNKSWTNPFIEAGPINTFYSEAVGTNDILFCRQVADGRFLLYSDSMTNIIGSGTTGNVFGSVDRKGNISLDSTTYEAYDSAKDIRSSEYGLYILLSDYKELLRHTPSGSTKVSVVDYRNDSITVQDSLTFTEVGSVNGFLVKMSPSQAAYIGRDGSGNIKTTIINESNWVLTAGTPQTLDTGSNGIYSVCKVNSTHYAYCWYDGSGTYITVVSISGTTSTVEYDLTITSSPEFMINVGEDKIFVAGEDNNAPVATYSWSGTVLSEIDTGTVSNRFLRNYVVSPSDDVILMPQFTNGQTGSYMAKYVLTDDADTSLFVGFNGDDYETSNTDPGLCMYDNQRVLAWGITEDGVNQSYSTRVYGTTAYPFERGATITPQKLMSASTGSFTDVVATSIGGNKFAVLYSSTDNNTNIRFGEYNGNVDIVAGSDSVASYVSYSMAMTAESDTELVALAEGASGLTVYHMTHDTTSITGTTSYNLNSVSYGSLQDFCDIEFLASNVSMCLFYDATNGVRARMVDTTTGLIGSETAVHTSIGNCNVRTTKLSDTEVAVVVLDKADDTLYLYIVQKSGTTINVGTAISKASVSNPADIVVVDDQIVMFWNDSSNISKITGFTWSGTTLTEQQTTAYSGDQTTDFYILRTGVDTATTIQTSSDRNTISVGALGADTTSIDLRNPKSFATVTETPNNRKSVASLSNGLFVMPYINGLLNDELRVLCAKDK